MSFEFLNLKEFQNKYNLETDKINKQLIEDLFKLFENKDFLDLKEIVRFGNQYYVYILPDTKFRENVFKPLIKKIFSSNNIWNYFVKEINYRLTKIGDITNRDNCDKTEKIDSCAEIKILEVVFDSFNKKEIGRLIKYKEDLIFDIFMKIHKKLNWQYYCVESEFWNYDLDSVFWHMLFLEKIGKTMSKAIMKGVEQLIEIKDFYSLSILYELHLLNYLTKKDLIYLFKNKKLYLIEFFIDNIIKSEESNPYPRIYSLIDEMIHVEGFTIPEKIKGYILKYVKETVIKIINEGSSQKTEYLIKLGLFEYVDLKILKKISLDKSCNFLLKCCEVKVLREEWDPVLKLDSFLENIKAYDESYELKSLYIKKYIIDTVLSGKKEKIYDLYGYDIFDLLTKEHFFQLIKDNKIDFFETLLKIFQSYFDFYPKFTKRICKYIEQYVLETVPPKEAQALKDLKKILNRDFIVIYNVNIEDSGFLIKFKNGHITGINLRENDLLSLPETIGDFSYLRYLHLYDNKLKKLPDSIGNLKSLEHIDISFNSLERLPESMKFLTDLNYIDITANKGFLTPSWLFSLPSIKIVKYNFYNLLDYFPKENVKEGIYRKSKKTSIEKLETLALNASNGKDNLKEAALGCNGYGFIFRDPFECEEPYITLEGSSKLCSMDLSKDQILKILENNELTVSDLDFQDGLLFLSHLKTVFPKLKVGGDEMLFNIWAFIRTKNGKQFPIVIYSAQSGIAIGAWETYNKNFHDNFKSILNSTPFNFSENELQELVEAIKIVIRKLPLADYCGFYQDDTGKFMIGVKKGEPFIIELE